MNDPGTTGVAAVRLARRALEISVIAGDPEAAVRSLQGEEFAGLGQELRGVFVTLRTHPAGRLRGCIGFPMPIYPLRWAIVGAAGAAALEDPRFAPVRAPELPHLSVEVSILSVPEPLDGPPEDRAGQVEVGRHGLIVEARRSSGLLLPQVAVEQGWTPREFLDGTCEKAGLRREEWRHPHTQVRRFHAEVFREVRPSGPVEPAPLG